MNEIQKANWIEILNDKKMQVRNLEKAIKGQVDINQIIKMIKEIGIAIWDIENGIITLDFNNGETHYITRQQQEFLRDNNIYFTRAK